VGSLSGIRHLQSIELEGKGGGGYLKIPYIGVHGPHGLASSYALVSMARAIGIAPHDHQSISRIVSWGMTEEALYSCKYKSFAFLQITGYLGH
jgi:hypothetical protein